MTDLLSPSPWTDRQDYIREHPPLSHSAALARIDALEAELAEERARSGLMEFERDQVAQRCKELSASLSKHVERGLALEDERDAALARIAELEARIDELEDQLDCAGERLMGDDI